MRNAAGYLFLTLTTFTLLGSMAALDREAVVAQAQPAAPKQTDIEKAEAATKAQIDALQAKLAQPKKLPDPAGFKLGYIKPTATIDAGKFKIVILKDGRQKIVPRLGAYLDTAKRITAGVPPPAALDYTTKAMASVSRYFLNDQLGDCVVASTAHRIGIWSANDKPGTVIMPTDAEVRQRYQQWCGPGDNGCNITDVLDGHKRDGMPCQGTLHKIDDYVAVDWSNKDEVQTALYLFGGGMCVGFDLPGGWYNSQDIWSVANATGGIVGGHDVCEAGYTAQGVKICTWGGTRMWEWAAFNSKKWISECYVSLSPDWYGEDGVANAVGLDVATLKADLAMLGQGKTPPIPDPVPPPPPVTVAIGDVAGTVGAPVTFFPRPAGGTAPYRFAYNYGDGGLGGSDTHTYTDAGSFKVLVTVTDAKGQTGTGSCMATVTSTPVPTPGIATLTLSEVDGSRRTFVESDNTGTVVIIGGVRYTAAPARPRLTPEQLTVLRQILEQMGTPKGKQP